MNSTFFVKNITGKTFVIKLNSQEKNPASVVEEIKNQLPESYNNKNFKVICEGKDLNYFDFFPTGVGNYFAKLACVFVIGNSDLEKTQTTATNMSSPNTSTSSICPDEKVKVKLLERLKKFEKKGFKISCEFNMNSNLNDIKAELALLHVLNDIQKAKQEDEIPVRQCIAHGCGNYLSPDEDQRCKICDY